MGLKDGFGLNGGGSGGGGANIYNSDGTLTNNRFLDGDGQYILDMSNLRAFNLSALESARFAGQQEAGFQVAENGVSVISTSNVAANTANIGDVLCLTDSHNGYVEYSSISDALTKLPEFASIAAAQGAGYSGKYVTLTGVTVGVLTLNLVVKVP